MSDLDAIEGRANAATPGPWFTQPMTGEDAPAGLTAITDGVLGVVGSTLAPAEAEFIAHARTDIPALLRRAHELEAAQADIWDQGYDARAEYNTYELRWKLVSARNPYRQPAQTEATREEYVMSFTGPIAIQPQPTQTGQVDD